MEVHVKACLIAFFSLSGLPYDLISFTFISTRIASQAPLLPTSQTRSRI